MFRRVALLEAESIHVPCQEKLPSYYQRPAIESLGRLHKRNGQAGFLLVVDSG
jgi:hypothetical protein